MYTYQDLIRVGDDEGKRMKTVHAAVVEDGGAYAFGVRPVPQAILEYTKTT